MRSTASPIRRIPSLAAALAFACAAAIVPASAGDAGAGSGDPDSRWVDIYGWIQAGERLEGGGHWPLALGCFIEAHRQAERLREEYPDYEAEMLAYRVPRLAERIEESDARLGPGDHEVMTKFLDFIDSYATGLEQRYASRFPEAIETLNAARILLDEIIHEKPDAYRDALATQYDLLHGSLVWLEGQVQFRESVRPPVVATGSIGDRGTTEFVKLSDLPADGDTILASASLFPFTPTPAPPPGSQRVERAGEAEAEPAAASDGAEEEGTVGRQEQADLAAGMKPFRMSARQARAAEPPAVGDAGDGVRSSGVGGAHVVPPSGGPAR